MAPDAEVRFTFDGKPVCARSGQALTTALLEAGVTTLTRSSKYRRPRGLYCAKGHCANCLLRVDGRPHVRACTVAVRDGMEVASEGATTQRVDPFRAIDHVGQLFPVGFQYRYFKRQNIAWRLWEGQLRKLAAETKIPAPFPVPEGRRTRCDLLVVGAGPAGVATAATAAGGGLDVMLVGRRSRLAAAAASSALVRAHVDALSASDRCTVLAPATVVAAFGDRYVVDAGDHAVEVTAAASVLATGAYERAVVFPGNDRPGVMLTSALRRLMVEEGALGSRKVVVVAEDDAAYAMTAELMATGARVVAIADVRATGPAAPAGVEVLRGARVVGVRGRGALRGLTVEVDGARRTLSCDLVGMSGGWQHADELRYSATSTGTTLVVGERAAPLDTDGGPDAELPVLQGVGAVAGARTLAAAVADGEVAGAWAAARAGGDREAMVAAIARRSEHLGVQLNG